MAINFPNTPTVDQEFTDGSGIDWICTRSVAVNGHDAWARKGTSDSSSSGIHIGDTPPSDTEQFPLWFNSATGMTLTSYNDGDSIQWVEESAGTTGPVGSDGANGADGATGPTGPTGVDGATGPQGVQGIDGPTGADGPTAVSTDIGNAATISGTDGLIFVEDTSGGMRMAIGNVNNALLDLPLNSSLHMKSGAGQANFNRASTGTYVDNVGFVRYAEIDEPRFENRGLLLEEASENSLLYSTDFENAAWIQTGVTLTANSTNAPDDTLTATEFFDGIENSYHSVSQQIQCTSGKQYTMSIYVKPGNYDICSLKAIGATSSPASIIFYVDSSDYDVAQNLDSLNIEKVGPEYHNWSKASITFTATITAMTTFEFLLDFEEGGPYEGYEGTMYFWGPQVEELGYATSYMPTQATSVGRARDSFEITEGIKNSSALSGHSSTILDVHMLGGQAQSDIREKYILNRDQRYEIKVTTGYMLETKEGTFYSPSAMSASPLTLGARIAMTYDGTTVIAYADGVPIGSASSPTGQPLRYDLISIGGDYTGLYNTSMHIKNFKTYNIALTETEVGLA